MSESIRYTPYLSVILNRTVLGFAVRNFATVSDRSERPDIRVRDLGAPTYVNDP